MWFCTCGFHQHACKWWSMRKHGPWDCLSPLGLLPAEGSRNLAIPWSSLSSVAALWDLRGPEGSVERWQPFGGSGSYSLSSVSCTGRMGVLPGMGLTGQAQLHDLGLNSQNLVSFSAAVPSSF